MKTLSFRFNRLVAFILLTMVPFFAFGQTRYDSLNFQRLQAQEQQYPSILRRNTKVICDISRAVGISHEPLFEILANQANYYGIEDQVQDMQASRGDYLDLNEVNELLQKTLAEDSYRESVSYELHPKRNIFNHRLFSSIGPAQIQIYWAYRLNRKYNFLPAEMSLNQIAKKLTTIEGAALFLAYEILWYSEIYKQEANIEIANNIEILWQLHKLGSPIQRAMFRKYNPTPLKSNAEIKWKKICDSSKVR